MPRPAWLAPWKAGECRSMPPRSAGIRDTDVPAPSPFPQLLRHALRLQEQQQVVAAAGLAVGAAHVEAAERVAAHHRAGALAVQVEVADEELLARLLQL